jgi:hypothetical protein
MTIDTKIEKQIVTGLITSDSFIKNIQPLLKESSLQSPFTSKVASWCLDYYKEYQKAPGKHIQNIYKKKKKRLKEEEAFLIEEFLERLSNHYVKASKPFHDKFVLDESKEYLRTISLNKLKDKISTALEKGSITKAEKLVEEFIPLKDAENIEDVFKDVITAEALENKSIHEVTWVLEDTIPLGATFLAGKAKQGKSFFILNAAIALAFGHDAFGAIPTEQKHVLYLAMEEPERRTQNRIKLILRDEKKDQGWSKLLHICPQGKCPRSDRGGFAFISKWMEQHPDTKLIIIDTLEKWRKPRGKNEAQYVADYQVMSNLQEFANKHNMSIVVIHHTIKTKASDVFDEIGGSMGLQAGADTLAILAPAYGDKNLRTIEYRGRDVPDFKKTYDFNRESGKFILTDKEADDYRKVTKERMLIKSYVEAFSFVKRGAIKAMAKGQVGKGLD